jgi:hypothetical protein
MFLKPLFVLGVLCVISSLKKDKIADYCENHTPKILPSSFNQGSALVFILTHLHLMEMDNSS